MAATRAASKKSIHVPQEGEFLSDGERLVEVVGKVRAGLSVRDASEALDAQPEILTMDEALTKWRVIELKGEDDES